MSLTQQQRVDIIKIIAENNVLLTTAILTDLIESKKAIDANQDNEAVFNKMIFEFLSGIGVDPIIYRVLYLYLENVHRSGIKGFTITKTEYDKILKFNVSARSNEDILNMFTNI